MGLLARVIGVFVSPRATYAAVAARPRWFGALAVTVLLVAGGFFVFLSTEVGQQAVIDQQLQFMESLGLKLNDTQVEQMESRAQYARYTTAAGQLVGIPIVQVIIAAILLGIFNVMLAGTFEEYIVGRLAEYGSPTEIALEVRRQFGVKLSRQSIVQYDPTRVTRCGKEWGDLFGRESLDAAEFVMELEEEFGVAIPDWASLIFSRESVSVADLAADLCSAALGRGQPGERPPPRPGQPLRPGDQPAVRGRRQRGDDLPQRLHRAVQPRGPAA